MRLLKILAGLALVCEFWLLYRLIENPRPCLKSKYITILNYHDQRIERCEFYRRFDWHTYAQQQPEVLSHWQQRLDALEPIFNWLNQMRDPQSLRTAVDFGLQVHIDTLEPDWFSFSRGHLSIGEHLAQAKGQLERAVLMTWLKFNRSDLITNQFNLEVLTDVFLKLHFGSNFQVVDPHLSSPDVDQSQTLNLFPSLLSLREYCNSSRRSLAHLEYCSFENGRSGDPSFDRPTPWGFKMLISNLVVDKISNLSVVEKVRLFSRPIFPASTRAFHSPPEPQAELMHWQNWIQHEVSANLEQLGLHRTARVGLLQPLDAVILIQEADLFNSIKSSLQNWLAIHPNTQVAMAAGHRWLFLPADEPVQLRSTQGLTARRWLLLGCRWPNVQELMHLQHRKIEFLQVCDNQQIPKWSSLDLEKNTNTDQLTWSELNQPLEYAVVHIPALKQWSHDSDFKSMAKVDLKTLMLWNKKHTHQVHNYSLLPQYWQHEETSF